ncbi:hypothetical protein K1719_004175 [Acacia pycnantha]|nr:hypothetical protein K1719_004175 [Acacia pycnantha]
MEETRKFVCRFCNKRFPSGKSLGGHIRTHMNQHSRNRAIADSSKFEGDDVDDEAAKRKRKKRDLSSDYGLRENPRKTKRFVHPFFTLHHKEKFCRECGKGFSSLKALCGHLACHTSDKQKFAIMDDVQSDTETSDPEDLKRTRFMTLNNRNNNNPTSSVSEVEQEEEGVEEVAICLMLLSKGFYSHKGGFDLDKESNSDNYSAIFEAKAKSHSLDARIGINDGQNKVKNSVHNDTSETVKVGKDKTKLKTLDSGYSRYGSKMEDSNVSIHGVFKNDVFNGSKVKDGYGFKDYDVSEPKKMMNNRSRNNSESKKLVLGNLDKFDDSFNSAKQENVGNNLDERVSCKKKKQENVDNNLDERVSCKKKKQENVGNNLDERVSCKKKKKTCFPNHEVVYKKDSYDSESSSYDSTDSDSFPYYSYQKPKSSNKLAKSKKVMKSSKKTKEHECPICNRTFRSGQALGGHKRSHLVGGFEENNNNNNNNGLIVHQESPSPSPAVVPCLIDLNLPAPADE